MRISDWSSDVCSSDLLEAAAARERVPMAEAWASSADACPSAVPIGAAAAVPWLAIPSEPDVKEVNTLPLKRKTVKTKAPARPAATVRKPTGRALCTDRGWRKV